MKTPTYLALLLAAFMPICLSGQFAPPKKVVIKGQNPGMRNAVIADINSDGVPDLVFTPINIEKTLLRKGLEDFPYFEGGFEVLTGIKLLALTADFDGDGHQDAFLYGQKLTPNETGSLFWSKNDGTGNFGPLIQIPNQGGAGARVAIIADPDQDGDQDILYSVYLSASTEFPNGVVWLENDGLGNFTSHVISTEEGYGLAESDFDGDGDLDILVTRLGSNKVAIFENVNNEFSFLTAFPSIQFPSEIHVADFNNDGFDDFVLAATSPNRLIGYYENVGGQSFEFTLINNAANKPSTNVKIVDFDNNGTKDIIWSSINAGNAGWFSNDGTGVFSDQGILLQGNEANVRFLVPFDFNNDGLVDFINVSPVDGFSAVAINTGGSLSLTPLSGAETFVKPRATASIRDSGDLVDQLISIEPENGIVRILGDLFDTQPSVELILTNIITTVKDALPLNANADGITDVVVNYAEGLKVFIRSQEALIGVEVPNSANLDHIEVYDINEDGIDDILGISVANQSIVAFLSNGAGYDPPVTVVTATESAPVFTIYHVGTSKGIIFPKNTSNKLILIPYITASGFGTEQVISNLLMDITVLTSGDTNNDGLPDLVGASDVGIFRILGQGNLTFGSPETIDFASDIQSITIADVTNNGRNDILVHAEEGGFYAAVYRQTVIGTFLPKLVRTNKDIVSLVVGEFDGLEGNDVAFSEAGIDAIFVSANVGSANDANAIALNDALPNSVVVSGFILYPNPVENDFRIEVSETLHDTPLRIALYDVSGKQVYLKNKVFKSEVFDISFLPQGSYTVVVSDEDSKRKYHSVLIKK